jgi:hypothetical protein
MFEPPLGLLTRGGARPMPDRLPRVRTISGAGSIDGASDGRMFEPPTSSVCQSIEKTPLGSGPGARHQRHHRLPVRAGVHTDLPADPKP